MDKDTAAVNSEKYEREVRTIKLKVQLNLDRWPVKTKPKQTIMCMRLQMA